MRTKEQLEAILKNRLGLVRALENDGADERETRKLTRQIAKIRKALDEGNYDVELHRDRIF